MAILNGKIVLAATVLAALVTSGAANAQSCGSVFNQTGESKLWVTNNSKDYLWVTVYKTSSRSGKTNWQCLKPGQSFPFGEAKCSTRSVLAEQKRGNDCGGSNLSEPMVPDVRVEANNKAQVAFSNAGKGYRLTGVSNWK